MVTLENEWIRLATTPEAGEMLSLKHKGVELLYQGDEGWSGRNPSLFPIVGNTLTGTYEVDGRTYAMKNHGLVRYARLAEHFDPERDSVTYTLCSDEETRKQYPVDFKYEMTYRLEGRKVRISYQVENTGERNMPFTFGLHPAFLLEDEFSSYSLTFEPQGSCLQVDVKDGSESVAWLGEWQLDREQIRKAATLVYKDIACDKVVLKHRNKPVLAVDFPDFPFLALWTHPVDSHFLCIEPWYGHADFGAGKEDFASREGMMVLEPGRTWHTEYAIEVLE